MGLVACMGSPVDCQSTALDEGLSAWLVVASIRPFIGMYPIMPLEVGLSIEALLCVAVVSSGHNWDPAPADRSRQVCLTFEQPSGHSHWKGRAAMSAAEAPPLEGLCLLGLSDIGSDKDDSRGAGRSTLV